MVVDLELKDERESITWMTIWIDGICRKLKAGKSKVGGNFQDPECCEFVHVQGQMRLILHVRLT